MGRVPQRVVRGGGLRLPPPGAVLSRKGLRTRDGRLPHGRGAWACWMRSARTWARTWAGRAAWRARPFAALPRLPVRRRRHLRWARRIREGRASGRARPRLAGAERNGVVLAWHGAAGRPPAWEVPELEVGRVRSAFRRTFVIKGHPQETTENGVDLGHLGDRPRVSRRGGAGAAALDGPRLRVELRGQPGRRDLRPPRDDARRVHHPGARAGLLHRGRARARPRPAQPALRACHPDRRRPYRDAGGHAPGPPRRGRGG